MMKRVTIVTFRDKYKGESTYEVMLRYGSESERHEKINSACMRGFEFDEERSVIPLIVQSKLAMHYNFLLLNEKKNMYNVEIRKNKWWYPPKEVVTEEDVLEELKALGFKEIKFKKCECKGYICYARK